MKSNIIDVNRLTKSISIDSLKLLILNELSSKTEEIQLYSDVFDKREELIESWQNPNTYEDNELLGLEEREKGEKLTFDQIKKLKELMTNSEMQINEISYKYWISYSVLIKIKNKAFEEIENLKTRKANKIYDQKKEIIISLIKFYIQRYAHKQLHKK